MIKPAEMVERVARALCIHHGGNPDRLWFGQKDVYEWMQHKDDAEVAINEVVEAINEIGGLK